MDLRGCGDSSRGLPLGACQPRRAVDDIVAVMTALGSHADLLGFSFGGHLAQMFAAAHPDRLRTLILASTTAYDGDRQRDYQHESPHWNERRRHVPERVWPSTITDGLAALTPVGDRADAVGCLGRGIVSFVSEALGHGRLFGRVDRPAHPRQHWSGVPVQRDLSSQASGFRC